MLVLCVRVKYGNLSTTYTFVGYVLHLTTGVMVIVAHHNSVFAGNVSLYIYN